MNIGIIITDHNVKEALSIVDFGYIIYNGQIIKRSPKEIITDKFVKKIYLEKIISSLMSLNKSSIINGVYVPPGTNL